MTTMIASRRGQLGFTIIEALVALVVMGFGILALAGMQATMSRNADDARQRTEAARLAQEKVEELRSFTGIAATLVGQGTVNATAINWNALANGSDTVTTNAAYTRTWTFAGVTTDPSRPLTVTVAWTDRVSQAQIVSLSTVISKSDPRDSGFLGFPLPQNTNLKRPKNRNLDIPIPAIDLGTGKSAAKFGTGNQFVLFDNNSGDVINLCTSTQTGSALVTDLNAQLALAATSQSSTCTAITGYIVAGYLGRDSSVSATDWNAIQGGLGINTGSLTRNAAGSSAISCQFGDAIDQTSGAVIANFKYYLCIIPLAPPSTPPATNGPYNWSGKMLIAGPSVWNSAGNKFFVCRYQYTATNFLTDPNQRNVQPYVEVNKSIDQQNYLIATTANNTSTTAPACPSSMTATDYNAPSVTISTGVLHQDCRSTSNPVVGGSTANFATACPLFGATTSYAVTYNGNTPTFGTAPTDPLSPYTNGTTVTVLGNTGIMTKTGFSFAGWNTAADGSGTIYTAGATFVPSANTTLYARWSTNTTYTVVYDGNTAIGAVPVDTSSPYTAGSTPTVRGNTGSLTKTGNTFSGWNTLANGSGTAYAPGAILPAISGNVILYAQWVVPPSYTMAYGANGGSGSVPPEPMSPYVSGSTVTVKTNSGPLSRTAFSFNGWNTAANGSGTAFSPNDTFNITNNTTLFAQWSPVTLTTPTPSFTGTAVPRPLTWPAVNGATLYSVSSCTLVNSNSATSCTPINPTDQALNSVTPVLAIAGNNKTNVLCYSVSAKGPPYLPSGTSVTKCILRADTGTYSYP